MPEQVDWVDSDGVLTTLVKTRGATGRYMPPVALREEAVPEQDGSRVRSVRFDARQVVVPVFVDGASRQSLIDRVRALAKSMNPKRGTGTLRSTGPDGTVRDLYCRYVDGLGFEERFPQFAIPSLLFRASDPFWYDQADTVAAYQTGTPATFFPLFPLRLSSSEVFADVIVANGGDVDAWPVWTVTGPGSGLRLRNLATGEVLGVDVVLAAGESLVADTRPGVKTVTKNDGSNLFSLLTADSSLWSLPSGSTSVRVELTAATAASRVQLNFRRRWLSC